MRPTEHGFVGPLAGELEEYIRFKCISSSRCFVLGVVTFSWTP